MKIILTPIAVNGSRCKTETELSCIELRVVAALIAARLVGRVGVTREELVQLTGSHSNINMTQLEKRLWVRPAARLRNSRAMAYAATDRAIARLGIAADWEPMRFTDEELPRVDPNVPGFLVPTGNEQERWTA